MVPRPVGTDWEVFAPAKLNLYLEVLGKRKDGFHDLETLMVPVRFADQLRWSEDPRPVNSSCYSIADTCTFSVDSACLARCDSAAELCSSRNLVCQAALKLAQRAGVEPQGHFHLTKRILVQAGMGGGSSDAAAALVLANTCWKLGLGKREMAELAAELGSDVPFFIHEGPAICRGRGELVEPVGRLAPMHFVIVKPRLSLSTARVFGELGSRHSFAGLAESAGRVGGLVRSLRRGALGASCRSLFNRLEGVVTKIAPEITWLKLMLRGAGCWNGQMTGSGSAVFGLVNSAVQARRIARWLAARRLGTVLATSSGW